MASQGLCITQENTQLMIDHKSHTCSSAGLYCVSLVNIIITRIEGISHGYYGYLVLYLSLEYHGLTVIPWCSKQTVVYIFSYKFEHPFDVDYKSVFNVVLLFWDSGISLQLYMCTYFCCFALHPYIEMLCIHFVCMLYCHWQGYTFIQDTPSGQVMKNLIWQDFSRIFQRLLLNWLSNAAAAEWGQYLTSTLPDMLVQRQDGESRWLMEDIFANNAVQKFNTCCSCNCQFNCWHSIGWIICSRESSMWGKYQLLQSV